MEYVILILILGGLLAAVKIKTSLELIDAANEITPRKREFGKTGFLDPESK